MRDLNNKDAHLSGSGFFGGGEGLKVEKVLRVCTPTCPSIVVDMNRVAENSQKREKKKTIVILKQKIEGQKGEENIGKKQKNHETPNKCHGNMR